MKFGAGQRSEVGGRRIETAAAMDNCDRVPHGTHPNVSMDVTKVQMERTVASEEVIVTH